jgi:hypothetical protein
MVQASTADRKPYEYFGGSVFEVLAHLYPPKDGYPVLEDTVDPTGDIDILLHVPHPVFPNPSDLHELMEASPFATDVDTHGQLTPLTRDFMLWVFDTFCKQLERIPTGIWEDMFGDAEVFDPHVDSEGTVEKVFQRGRVVVVWIPLTENGNMSKIQLIVKFPGIEPDHLLEFVLSFRKTENPVMLDYTEPPYDRIELHGGEFPIESFGSVIRGNADALGHRSEAIADPVYKHKYWNHVGRQQYLNALLPRLLESEKGILTPAQYKDLSRSLFSLCVQLFQLKRSGVVDQETVYSMISNMYPFLFENRYDRRGYRVPIGLQGIQISIYDLRDTPYKDTTYLNVIRDVAPSFQVQKGGTRRQLKRQTRRRKTSRRA